MSGALKTLATFRLDLKEVRQMKWENKGRSVLYKYLCDKGKKVINWRNDSCT
jgi:hypothetical protein